MLSCRNRGNPWIKCCSLCSLVIQLFTHHCTRVNVKAYPSYYRDNWRPWILVSKPKHFPVMNGKSLQKSKPTKYPIPCLGDSLVATSLVNPPPHHKRCGHFKFPFWVSKTCRNPHSLGHKQPGISRPSPQCVCGVRVGGTDSWIRLDVNHFYTMEWFLASEPARMNGSEVVYHENPSTLTLFNCSLISSKEHTIKLYVQQTEKFV